jgi:hypothetical protein
MPRGSSCSPRPTPCAPRLGDVRAGGVRGAAKAADGILAEAQGYPPISLCEMSSVEVRIVTVPHPKKDAPISTPHEVREMQFEASSGAPGWTDLLVAVASGRRFRRIRKENAPEVASGRGPQPRGV